VCDVVKQSAFVLFFGLKQSTFALKLIDFCLAFGLLQTMAPISIKVAGVSFSGRSDNIRKLLNDKSRLFVQCRLIHEQNNEWDSQAVSVMTRIGGLEMGYLARGALPFDERLVDGQFARLELGRCKSGVGVYARCALVPGAGF